MKTPSDQVFVLIQALSKTEKSYFKKFSSSSLSSNGGIYIELFDAISKMGVYKESVLKKQFQVKNFAEMKQYLYRQIRKALRSYYAERNVQIKLNNYLTDIQILYQKGLLEHCRDLIKKAEKLAERLEYHAISLQLNEYKIKIRNGLEDYANVQEMAVTEIQAFQYHSNQLENSLRYRIYKDLLFVERSQRVGTIGLKEIETTTPSPKKAPSTFFSKLYQQDVRFNLAAMYNNLEHIIDARKKIIDLYDAHPAFKKEFPELYIIALFDWINSCAVAGHPEIGLANMPKARKALTEYKLEKRFKLIRQAVLGSFEFQLNFELNNYAKAEEIYPKYVIWLQNNADQVVARHVVIFYYRLLTGAIYFERYDDALKFGAYIQENARFHIRLDIQVFTRLMLLLVHFELGNALFLSSFVPSTYQYTRNHDFESDFSSLLLHFFKTKVLHQNIQNRYVKQQLLKELKEKILSRFEENPSAKLVTNYFQIITWIDSRLLQKRMEDLPDSYYENRTY
jgi:hypothetical protein